ncbi:hypothetical protein RD1_1492 [Roseobacter denitrificans OCh 114]|uniref:Uncharacterized protein n=1 Tax=Roseobacter denitrificans (strain ATCC 33942 / OCh 114) TaxID=375451 RepID=Q16A68_ROSDO|nr:hypothetical protein RD1_1492 [Roseobacter denitrificans OCh 114]
MMKSTTRQPFETRARIGHLPVVNVVASYHCLH